MGETGEVDTAGREDDASSVLGEVTWVVGAGGEVGVFGELTSGGGRLGGWVLGRKNLGFFGAGGCRCTVCGWGVCGFRVLYGVEEVVFIDNYIS